MFMYLFFLKKRYIKMFIKIEKMGRLGKLFDDYKEQREQKIKDSELKLEKDNEYGYYGIYNKTENKFR